MKFLSFLSITISFLLLGSVHAQKSEINTEVEKIAENISAAVDHADYAFIYAKKGYYSGSATTSLDLAKKVMAKISELQVSIRAVELSIKTAKEKAASFDCEGLAKKLDDISYYCKETLDYAAKVYQNAKLASAETQYDPIAKLMEESRKQATNVQSSLNYAKYELENTTDKLAKCE